MCASIKWRKLQLLLLLSSVKNRKLPNSLNERRKRTVTTWVVTADARCKNAVESGCKDTCWMCINRGVEAAVDHWRNYVSCCIYLDHRAIWGSWGICFHSLCLVGSDVASGTKVFVSLWLFLQQNKENIMWPLHMYETFNGVIIEE